MVDYRTLQRGYFADDIHAIQRRGLEMMFRGTIHLLLLSAGLPRAADPRRRGARPARAWRATSSATTCSICGSRASSTWPAACSTCSAIQLPETHHHYLLATGFTDYWRRINIYWKDFMVRLFFNPVVFRLKRWPQPAALAVATLVGLPGHLAAARLPVVLAARDLGLPRARRPVLGRPGRAGPGQRPARRAAEPEPGPAAARGRAAAAADRRIELGRWRSAALKTAGTFTTIALLWSLWSSPSLAAWLDLLAARPPGPLTRSRIAMATTTQSTSVAAARINMLLSVALLVVGFVPWPQSWASVRALVDSARSPELNRAEREAHAGGYYEGLIGGGDGPEGARGELALRLMGKPNGWVRFHDADVVAACSPATSSSSSSSPDVHRTLFGQPFVTNSHGMHSPEVASRNRRAPSGSPCSARRWTWAGGSTYQETYSHRLEDWLNAHAGRQGLGPAGGSRCSTSPSPPTARCSGSRRSAARRWRSSPTW